MRVVSSGTGGIGCCGRSDMGTVKLARPGGLRSGIGVSSRVR